MSNNRVTSSSNVVPPGPAREVYHGRGTPFAETFDQVLDGSLLRMVVRDGARWKGRILKVTISVEVDEEQEQWVALQIRNREAERHVNE